MRGRDKRVRNVRSEPLRLSERAVDTPEHDLPGHTPLSCKTCLVRSARMRSEATPIGLRGKVGRKESVRWEVEFVRAVT